ncbi:hypothetical protein [Halomonas mongoliensis]|uniref:hypothetical protein n=1 Tax=Halomonas mongoliensis TaxID=321265 RepID=UPI00403AEC3F
MKGRTVIDSGLNEETILWRYLDTAKFLDLLTNQNLYLCRADRFSDKHEGSFTQSIRHAIEKSYEDSEIDFSYNDFKDKLRRGVYVNCWHKSRNDSMAMWKLYGQSNCAVAVTTTVGKLKKALDSEKLNAFLSIKKVDYVKHWRDPSLKIKPYSNVFAYKVVAYEYEKEVRVIADKFDDNFDNAEPSSGLLVKTPINEVLRSIVISPEAPQWYVQLIEDTVTKYGIRIPVRRSKLAFEPI